MNEKLLESVGKTLKTIFALLFIFLFVPTFFFFLKEVFWVSAVSLGMILYLIVFIYFLLTNSPKAIPLFKGLVFILSFIFILLLWYFYTHKIYDGS
jgi:hypothetical protein